MAKRPNLTEAQRDEIAELRERGWSERRIALKLDVSVGSVSWALLALGVDSPKTQGRTLPDVPAKRIGYRRGDFTVVRFNQADDAKLLALEAAGLNAGEIGRRLDPVRRPNSVVGRLRTLSRRQARHERLDQVVA